MEDTEGNEFGDMTKSEPGHGLEDPGEQKLAGIASEQEPSSDESLR